MAPLSGLLDFAGSHVTVIVAFALAIPVYMARNILARALDRTLSVSDRLRYAWLVVRNWRNVRRSWWPCPVPGCKGDCLICTNYKMPAYARYDDADESLKAPPGHVSWSYLRRVWYFGRWRPQPDAPGGADPFALRRANRYGGGY